MDLPPVRNAEIQLLYLLQSLVWIIRNGVQACNFSNKLNFSMTTRSIQNIIIKKAKCEESL
jgi:hypothetical protein